MKRGVLLISCVVFLAACPGAAQAWQRIKGEKYALLVGVNKYPIGQLKPLKYPEADIAALAEVLLQSGYREENVVVFTLDRGNQDRRFDPSASNIRRRLKQLLADRTEHDTVLIAFAGHGVQLKGEDENWFCPMDALVNPFDKNTLIGLTEVYKSLEKCPASLKLLLVDACRDDPLANDSRSAIDRFESLTRPPKQSPAGGVVAFYSCAANQSSKENDELGHGVFFHFVIDALKGAAIADHETDITLLDLQKYVITRVKDFVRAKHDDRQTPEVIGRITDLVPLVKLDPATRQLRAAVQAYNDEDYSKAITFFTEALRLNPQSTDAYVLRGDSYAILGELPKALADANAALAIKPDLATGFVVRGMCRGELGDLATALVDLDEAVRLNPRLAVAHLQRGLVLEKMKLYEKAIANLTTALGLDANLITAFLRRAKCYWILSQYDEAIADAEQALKLNPKSADAYWLRGDSLGYKGDLDANIRDCSEALKINPKHVEALKSRADCYRVQKKFPLALADCNAALAINPDHSGSLIIRGRTRYDRREYADAIKDLTAALKLNPDLTDAYFVRGKCELMLGHHDAAVGDLSAALERNPKLLKAQLFRAQTFLMKGEYKKAIADVDPLVENEGLQAEALAIRGESQRRLGEHRAAVRDLTAALKLDDQSLSTWASLARTHYALQDYDAMLADLKQLFQLNPDYDGDLYEYRGWVHAQRKDYDLAIADYTEAIRLNKSSAKAYFNRGLNWFRKGDKDRSQADRAKAIELDPTLDKVMYK